jgi:predicted TIM-barrel fold metal-dependent hydrolase
MSDHQVEAAGGAPAVDDFPKLISVDDHVIEPPSIWTDRLPAKYREIGPHVVRGPMKPFNLAAEKLVFEMGTEGEPVDWWAYEDILVPQTRMAAAAGQDREWITLGGTTYDEMRAGCYDPKARLIDMDANWTEASLCFPNFIRFCGQVFLEAKDKDLALLGARAYNDWMIEDWCGGSGGRLIPLCIIPLWDAELAAAEVYRNAARGCRAVAFSELPSNLGLPSVHDANGYWDPFLAACNETGTVINIHIGSGSTLLSTSTDAPPGVINTMNFAYSAACMTDWLMSGVFVRYPNLKIAMSEGQIGWIPYVLERADSVWEENRGWSGVAYSSDAMPPSQLYREHVFGCFFRDAHGLQSLDAIGVDNVMFEIDYPHSDSTWPRSRDIVEEQTKHLDSEAVRKIVRGNAIRLFGLDYVSP